MQTLNSTQFLRRYVPAALAVASYCLLTSSASACVQTPGQIPANKFAMARIQGQFRSLKGPQQAVRRADDSGARPSMVGMWMSTFTSGGEVVDAGFDVWHSDGTQILNDTPPPAAGAVCLGVWAQTGDYTYTLKHPTWLFDETNTTLIGVGYILESVTLDPGGNTYSGTFSLIGYDLDGNQVFEVDGEISGDRITVDPLAAPARRK